VPGGTFILISHSPYSEREENFSFLDWEVSSQKLYRTVKKEEEL